MRSQEWNALRNLKVKYKYEVLGCYENFHRSKFQQDLEGFFVEKIFTFIYKAPPKIQTLCVCGLLQFR